MGERLAAGNTAIALLANTIATTLLFRWLVPAPPAAADAVGVARDPRGDSSRIEALIPSRSFGRD
jgi:hypothetical protein